MPTPSRRPATSPTGAKPPGSDRVSKTPTKAPGSARLPAAAAKSAAPATKPAVPAPKPTAGSARLPAADKPAVPAKAPVSARLQAAAPAASAAPADKAAPPKAPSSARLPAAGAKAKAPSSGSNTAAAPATGTGATAAKPRPSSGTNPAAAPAKPAARPASRSSTRNKIAADDHDDAKNARSSRRSGTGTRSPQSPLKKWGTMGAITLGALCLVAFAISGPVMQSMRMSTMRAGADPAQLNAALAAADLWVANANADQVHTLLTQDPTFPPAVAVRLGKDAKTADDLLVLATRDSTPDGPRADALAAAAVVWGGGPHAALPKQLHDWSVDPKEDDSVAAGAIAVLAAAGGSDATANLISLLGTQGLADARLDAACAGLTKNIDFPDAAGAIGTLTGPNASRILKNIDLCAAITKHTSASNLNLLLTDARASDPALRVFALKTIGLQCPLTDIDTNDAQREKLAGEFAARLIPTTSGDELAALLSAASSLALVQSSAAIINLAPDAIGQSRPGLDQNTFAECLGKAFILGKTAASKKATSDHIGRLIDALDQPRTHALAAIAIGRIANPDLLPDLRPALIKLGAAGDPDAIAALTALCRQTFARKDIADANGTDTAKWQAWVVTEAHDSARLDEMMQWQIDNVKYQRIDDGKDRLQTNLDWLDKAIPELDAWVDSPTWLPPLDGTRSSATDLQGKLKLLKRSVGQSLVGAKE